MTNLHCSSLDCSKTLKAFLRYTVCTTYVIKHTLDHFKEKLTKIMSNGRIWKDLSGSEPDLAKKLQIRSDPNPQQ
jgi:hypothetical protein